jgi:hypothetical protein
MTMVSVSLIASARTHARTHAQCATPESPLLPFMVLHACILACFVGVWCYSTGLCT